LKNKQLIRQLLNQLFELGQNLPVKFFQKDCLTVVVVFGVLMMITQMRQLGSKQVELLPTGAFLM